LTLGCLRKAVTVETLRREKTGDAPRHALGVRLRRTLVAVKQRDGTQSQLLQGLRDGSALVSRELAKPEAASGKQLAFALCRPLGANDGGPNDLRGEHERTGTAREFQMAGGAGAQETPVLDASTVEAQVDEANLSGLAGPSGWARRKTHPRGFSPLTVNHRDRPLARP
jgi:hypothetical protein